MAKYRKAFPVRAKVAAVLKGKLDGKDVSFSHKHPGRSVIREAEFNKPAVAQKGTFYLKDEAGTLVLIGYIAKPAAATQRISPRTQPAAGGAPVKGLRVTLAAQPDVLLTGISSSEVNLKVTFTNVSKRPLKLTQWMLRFVLVLTDPDGRPVTPQRSHNRADFIGPREADVKTLAPGGNISFILREFPHLRQWNDDDHFGLSKPGRYRLRLIYTSKLGHTRWPAGFKECWQGTIRTNEVAIHVLHHNGKGPHPVGPLLRLLRQCNQVPSLWAAEKLVQDPKAGLPALAGMLDASKDWRVGVHAASGLMRPGSKAPAELKRKAETFLLECLRRDYRANGLCEPAIYLKPTDWGLRWLIERVPSAEQPKAVRTQGMRLLALFALSYNRFPAETRKVFLAGLEDKDPEIRLATKNCLAAVRVKEDALRRKP